MLPKKPNACLGKSLSSLYHMAVEILQSLLLWYPVFVCPQGTKQIPSCGGEFDEAWDFEKNIEELIATIMIALKTPSKAVGFHAHGGAVLSEEIINSGVKKKVATLLLKSSVELELDDLDQLPDVLSLFDRECATKKGICVKIEACRKRAVLSVVDH